MTLPERSEGSRVRVADAGRATTSCSPPIRPWPSGPASFRPDHHLAPDREMNHLRRNGRRGTLARLPVTQACRCRAAPPRSRWSSACPRTTLTGAAQSGGLWCVTGWGCATGPASWDVRSSRRLAPPGGGFGGSPSGGLGPLGPPEAWCVRLRIRRPRSDVVVVARSSHPDGVCRSCRRSGYRSAGRGVRPLAAALKT
jgi:hypothetical protein